MTRLVAGDLSFTLQDGGLRHIRWQGKELLRGIMFLVRDRDWGTLVPDMQEIRRDIGDRIELAYRATYRSGGATLAVDLAISAGADGISLTAKGAPDAAFETNRTGFTILHPAGVAGCPVTVTHTTGTEETHFPTLIDPWQPFMDITSLTHIREGLQVSCRMEGDTFEMEDQRQWGDASFKTYNRPLALPWPYDLPAGQEFNQSVHLTWAETNQAGNAAIFAGVDAPFPDTAIVVTPDQIDADVPFIPQRWLCHLDMSLGGIEAQCAAFARLQQRFPQVICDLELVATFDPSVPEAMANVRAAMDNAGFAPDSVLVCPAVDRQSTPPGSEWPECPPLADIHAAAKTAFTGMKHGGGMVSFFPELNRKRPPAGLDFISHGLCPIVHAADDLHVMETLETIPHITASARAIIGAAEYRIGPSTIAMRQNPYGSRTIPNPDGQRICMADDDPRHRSAFGAAYVVGLATALATSGAAVWTPAALAGPRGLTGPITDAIAALSRYAGQQVAHAEISGGLAELHVGGSRFRANLTDGRNGGLAPYEWRLL